MVEIRRYCFDCNEGRRLVGDPENRLWSQFFCYCSLHQLPWPWSISSCLSLRVFSKRPETGHTRSNRQSSYEPSPYSGFWRSGLGSLPPSEHFLAIKVQGCLTHSPVPLGIPFGMSQEIRDSYSFFSTSKSPFVADDSAWNYSCILSKSKSRYDIKSWMFHHMLHICDYSVAYVPLFRRWLARVSRGQETVHRASCTPWCVMLGATASWTSYTRSFQTTRCKSADELLMIFSDRFYWHTARKHGLYGLLLFIVEAIIWEACHSVIGKSLPLRHYGFALPTRAIAVLFSLQNNYVLDR